MANRIDQLLDHWYPQRDKLQWVLATIVATQGASYRKTGAMMLINSLGQHYGLLSGGCLEADIMRQARRCWDSGKNRIVQYDMREEGDFAWQLGIGCGGMVRILLQPVGRDNDYLQLNLVRQQLQKRCCCYYRQLITESSAPVNQLFDAEQWPEGEKYQQLDTDQDPVLLQCIEPAPYLAIFGGGVDAQPLVAMAAELGWQIIIIDPRSGYARGSRFSGVQQIVRKPIEQIEQADWLQQIDMAVVMTHSLHLDGQALALVQQSSARYVGMLGPEHRTEQVLAEAGLARNQLVKPLANPVGLRLGGELPESIALAILAEAHAVIEEADARSISDLI